LVGVDVRVWAMQTNSSGGSQSGNKKRARVDMDPPHHEQKKPYRPNPNQGKNKGPKKNPQKGQYWRLKNADKISHAQTGAFQGGAPNTSDEALPPLPSSQPVPPVRPDLPPNSMLLKGISLKKATEICEENGLVFCSGAPSTMQPGAILSFPTPIDLGHAWAKLEHLFPKKTQVFNHTLDRSGPTKEELKDLPLGKFSGNMLYVSKIEDVDGAVNTLLQECADDQTFLLGIDCEWRPQFVKNSPQNLIACIQISSGKSIAIFHMSQMRRTNPNFKVPSSLAKLFADSNIIKVTLGDDVKRLHSDYGILTNGAIDLHHIPFVKFGCVGCSGLSALCGRFLGYRLAKKQTMTNWEIFPLSPAQKEYAALDALATRNVYLIIRDHHTM